MKRELQAVSLKAIQAEMRTIEKRLVELETQGKNIELNLRQLPPPGEPGEKPARIFGFLKYSPRFLLHCYTVHYLTFFDSIFPLQLMKRMAICRTKKLS